MAEDKLEPREIDYRQWLPWTQLFRGFWVAVDPKKLLLAAAGILVMAFGWWLLATIFYTQPRDWPADYPAANYQTKDSSDPRTDEQRAFAAFKKDRNQWNVLYAAAGNDLHKIDPGDLAESPEEFKLLRNVWDNETVDRARLAGLTLSDNEAIRIQSLLPKDAAKVEPGSSKVAYLGREKRHGELRTWPWFEDRGPNPYRLVTGHAEAWQRGHFFDWLVRDEIPVLLEPLVKFIRPITFLLSPYTGFLEGLYLLLVIAWTVATWAIFGGAITRMAAVEMARNDKISFGDALRYVVARWRTYLFASFAPLVGLAVCTLFLMIFFGIPNWIPFLAELWMGLLLPLALGIGFCMAILLIGLVGWPMIHATLGAEGSDSFDALSRCYSYVLQKPWSYLWYALVAVVYGAIVVFFVGLLGSLTVYLTKWGISQTPLTQRFDRDPSYMFMWAPTSFEWQRLLVQNSPLAAVTEPTWHWYNYIGPVCVAVWLGLIFLMIIGFGYSYFWSASTIIYLMMRRKVDDTELDEVYLEEEELSESYAAPVSPPPTTPQPAPSGTTGLQMVEPPSLVRTTAAAPPATSVPTTVTENSTGNPRDGTIPAGGPASS